MKKFLILVLFALLMFVSYRYSGIVHRFYLKSYYNYMYTEDELVKKAWTMYDDGEYRKLEGFLEPLLDIYIWNNELKRVAGLNYIKLDEPVKGAELFASSFENGAGESADLMKVLKILFQDGSYGEVISFYDRNIMRGNANCAFYYGASLYNLSRFEEARRNLDFARAGGFIGDEIDYYTGVNYEELGDMQNAALFLRSAYDMNRQNRDAKSALIRVYRKTGEFEKAEVLLRTR